MAKRKDDNVLQGPFELARVLPWWLGLALAVTVYGALHHYASIPAPTQAIPGQIGDMVVGQLFKTLATVGQYLVPLALLTGAAVSYFAQRKREQLAYNVAQSRHGDALRRMIWNEFEGLIGQAFRTHGYTVTEPGGAGADGGIDLQLRKGRELFLVQCKQWQAYKVSVDVVRELHGVMAAQGAAGGFVVTSGVFTADAKAFAKGKRIALVDGTALTMLIKQAQVAALARKTMPGPGARRSPSTERPHCPRCGNVMVRRTAKQGAKMGSHFWGCVTYPECCGTRGL
ncbi:restriction endonuclease [Ralstonia syzygii]|uniref:Putative endonuclease n=1 Tax=Ralstonia syzygii R24 TaxID=907261 RepID=G3A2X5_9RALS|nr:restriction endonuclease [Ralstonia syzygii]CCA85796.1 putative endonuclease [Ralstonia syzygii R24]